MDDLEERNVAKEEKTFGKKIGKLAGELGKKDS